MKKHLFALAILFAFPATARADDSAVQKAAQTLVGFGSALADAKSNGTTSGSGFFEYNQPSACTDALAAAEKAGATGDTRLYAFGWPDSTPTYEYDSMKGSSVALKGARDVCAEYAVWQPVMKAATAVAKSAKHLEYAGDGGVGAYVAKDGTTCIELIDRVDASSRKLAVKIGAETMTLDEGRKICQRLVDKGAQHDADEAAAGKAKRAAAEAKFKKVGMKGKRLELFVDNELNGGGFPWYAAGCQTEITDPKKLAKAKKLFMWTAGANGGTLVSKYVFKGNTYKESSREFFNEAKAYKWCK